MPGLGRLVGLDLRRYFVFSESALSVASVASRARFPQLFRQLLFVFVSAFFFLFLRCLAWYISSRFQSP